MAVKIAHLALGHYERKTATFAHAKAGCPMMTNAILHAFQQARISGQKQIAVLVDPDKTNPESAATLACRASKAGIHYLMVGGSLVVDGQFEQCVEALQAHSGLPIVLFPGDTMQVSTSADGMLLLSLISGRNAELLIGRHVIAAPALRRSGLEILPTGYILIDGGAPTSVSYMSNTMPIPANKPDIAQCTAMAGEMLGLQVLYLDAGSGARNPVPLEMIRAVRKSVQLPLIVGGGLRSTEDVLNAFDAGADIVVVGTAIEREPDLLEGIAEAVRRRMVAG